MKEHNDVTLWPGQMSAQRLAGWAFHWCLVTSNQKPPPAPEGRPTPHAADPRAFAWHSILFPQTLHYPATMPAPLCPFSA